MATVVASCPDCGDVEFTTQDIHVSEVYIDGSGTFQFSCPDCACNVVRPADIRTIDLLLASGVARSYPVSESELKEFADNLDNGSTFEDAFKRLVQKTH